MQKRIDKLKATMYNTSIDGTQSRRQSQALAQKRLRLVFLFLSPLHQKSGRTSRSLFCKSLCFTFAFCLPSPWPTLLRRCIPDRRRRQAVRDARDQNPHRLEQAGDVACRRFAFDIRIGRQNDLVDILFSDAGKQFANADVFRPKPSIGEMVPCST